MRGAQLKLNNPLKQHRPFGSRPESRKGAARLNQETDLASVTRLDAVWPKRRGHDVIPDKPHRQTSLWIRCQRRIHHLLPECTWLHNLLAFDPAVENLGGVVTVAAGIAMVRSQRVRMSPNHLGGVRRLLRKVAPILTIGNRVALDEVIGVGEVMPVMRDLGGGGIDVVDVIEVLLML